MNSVYMRKLFFILFCFIFFPSFGQRGTSYPPLFIKYGGIRSKKQFEIDRPVNAIIFYHTDTIGMSVKVQAEKILPVEKADFKKISLEDTALHSVVFISGFDSLKLVRVPFNKNKLMRVLFDSLDFKIFDDVFTFSNSANDVDYSELIFKYKENYYEVFDFWAISLKRRMVDVLNNIFSLDLRYKDYKGKEDLLQSILKFQNQAIATALSKK